ncbi:ribosomal protein L13, archaeal/eukaryotic [Caldisphaera lagunensis DSM 15908]|uniref:Large ribosomal subunit protein uL13 n=1 Tax=Caldisphaera lagunensis (strain DSM 15908 / JCM 11604 / ANMR 0165 / IC-154) TaxID=1056495 RepID=L0A8V5_CALLD|nr:50S ribosomal protein L13 [Caldisphaera lagunensis]AFZ70313.1 ribosomal protein L13, archaeal/eukaryotic [Caldisphaera lagunensis DSM 15908]
MEEIVIDGSNTILGRLASHVAKLLLEGKKVVVLNSEKIAVSGDPTKLIQFYKDTILNVKTHYSHKWRPKRARSPTRLFKKTVSGMLPKNNKKGEEALKRLIVYVGVPKEYKNKEAIKVQEASVEKLGGRYTTLQVIAENMGWKVNFVE